MAATSTKENVAIGTVLAALAGGGYVLEDRYAVAAHDHEKIYISTPVFDTHVSYSEIRDMETRLERLQDKLASMLAIPVAQRQAWRREEIERLKGEIQRVRDKISRLG